MISEEFRKKLGDLAQAAVDKVSYVEHQHYGLVPESVDVDDRNWGSLEEAYDGIKPQVGTTIMLNQVKPPEGISRKKFIEQQVEEQTDFHSFSLLAQGTSTVVMLARSDDNVAVLRFSCHPESKAGSGQYKVDCRRTEFSGLLQGMREPIEIGKGMQVEVLPLGQIITLSSDEVATYDTYLDELTKDTIYKPSVHEKMVLPDGTLVAFDPGECRYVDEYWDMDDAQRLEEETKSKELVALRLQSWDVPEALNPLEKSGELKQNKFFTIVPPTGADQIIKLDPDAPAA